VTTSGTEGGNVVQSAATFGAFAVWSYAPDLKFGFAATSPFGQRVTNESNFVGRYQSLVSSITDLNFSISAAYRINDHISIGGGPVIEYFRPRFTQALNIGVNRLVGDPIFDLKGDDVAAGYNLGALYQFNDDTRVGIDYRSRITHAIEGTQSVFVPPLLAAASPATAGRLRLLNSSATTQVTLPDSVTLGFYHQIDPQWAVMADLQWTHWSLLRSLAVVPSSGAPITVLPLNWRNTWFGSVGASYRITEKLLLQGGFGYDESPVTDSNRNTRIPDSDRFNLGVGATYALLPNVNLQAAYLHTFFADASINNSATPTSGVIVGRYRNSSNALSLGAAVKF
jgi:long-chain fatty acid transport protein